MDVSKSECNIIDETLSQSNSSNVTTEFNYDDHIKPSANVKEASSFNIFECGRNILDKLDVTYQRAFAASKKPSSVPPAAYISLLREKYWGLQAKLLTERMARIDKDKIREAVSQLKYEDEAYHERIIEMLTHEYDYYSLSCEGDVTDSTDSDEITFNKLLLTKSDFDKKPAATKDPIKDTPSLKTPITGSYLVKRLCQSESGPTDMNSVVREPLTITENPFNPRPITENPIVTELNVIGQGVPRAVIEGTHTQSIIEGMEDIIHGDLITHMITNPSQVSLKSYSFPFDPEQAQTNMLTSLIEALLESNGNIRSTSILGASRTNQSRIFAPGMHEDISGRDNVQSTVRNDVRKADKLDTTVDGPTTDERNTASSRIEECTLKSIFRKEIKNLDSSSQMNLAKYLRVKTPDLVSFRDPTIQTDNVLNQRSGSVATRIADKDGIWRSKPSNIGTAATHDEIKNISEKLAFRKYIKDLDFETSKVLER